MGLYSNVHYNESREWVEYSASGLGHCPGAMVYDGLGITGEPPPQWLQERYDQGTDNEDLVISLLESQMVWKKLTKDECLALGYEFGQFNEARNVDYSSQVRVSAPVKPDVEVIAHLDGLVRLWAAPLGWEKRVGELRVLEVKAFGDSLWELWKRKGLAGFDKYQWQHAAQLRGAKLVCDDIAGGLFVIGHKSERLENRVFEIDSEYVENLPVPWIEVIKKISMVERAIADGEYSEVGKLCGDKFMYPCPFYQHHFKAEGTGEYVELDDSEIRDFDDAAMQYEMFKAQEAMAAEGKQAMAKVLIEIFDAHNSKGLKAKGMDFEVDDVVFERKGNVSWEKLTRDNPDVNVDLYRGKSSEVRYPKVKRIGVGTDAVAPDTAESSES